MPISPPLTATYRLQLNKDFNFAAAIALMPYLDALGVSHLYLSPILMAQPGSTHGYDTVDHTRINPELGTRDDFVALARAAKTRGLGIIVDFVPNHMGVGGAYNALWLDVLEHGPDSLYSDWFDIDWNWPGADGKLLVPFLGSEYNQALIDGQIVLRSDGRELEVWAYDQHKLPLRPESVADLLEQFLTPERAVAALNGTVGRADTWNALDAVIDVQHWRLAHFRVAADEINYRRFFINSDLAGICIDRPDVFDHAHALIFALVAEGHIDGLRIDHIDGLVDPKGYLDRLHERLPHPIPVFVEKILAPHEALRTEWRTDGTTGYEFGAQLTRLFLPPRAQADVSQIYADVTSNERGAVDEAYRSKLRVMDNELAAELIALSRRVAAMAQSQRATRDFPENACRKALREIIACLPVYRGYVDCGRVDPRDRRNLRYAIAKARRLRINYPGELLDFLQQLLLLELPPSYPLSDVLTIVGRFQQLTGPVMAKGLEDTALYRYDRLVALNEVGAHPERFNIDTAVMHAANRNRLRHHPQGLLGTTTHDTKRGEDTRARISAIAYQPALWAQTIRPWMDWFDNQSIACNDGYLLLQLLLGGWPLDRTELDKKTAETLTERLQAAMIKSIREARVHSDWSVANLDYEGRISAAVEQLLATPAFLADFAQLNAELASIGRRIALSQLLLKLTMPGTPDIYRGAETWEQSFVDPDNRRPVDFGALADRLAKTGKVGDRKLELTQTLLQARRQHPELFMRGSYEPLIAEAGSIGFCRRWQDQMLVAAVNLHENEAPKVRLPSKPADKELLEIIEPYALVRVFRVRATDN